MAIASFRQRGPHQWQAQVRKGPLSPIPGLRGIGTSCPADHPLQTKTFETGAEAEQWARAIGVEMDQGALVSRAEAESTTLKKMPDTKNGEARTVPQSTTAAGDLRTLPRALHDKVFLGVTTEAVKRSYRRATRRAGMADLRFHDLRHEATARLFEKRLNIMEVTSTGGRKDLRMLRRHSV